MNVNIFVIYLHFLVRTNHSSFNNTLHPSYHYALFVGDKIINDLFVNMLVKSSIFVPTAEQLVIMQNNVNKISNAFFAKVLVTQLSNAKISNQIINQSLFHLLPINSPHSHQHDLNQYRHHHHLLLTNACDLFPSPLNQNMTMTPATTIPHSPQCFNNIWMNLRSHDPPHAHLHPLVHLLPCHPVHVLTQHHQYHPHPLIRKQSEISMT